MHMADALISPAVGLTMCSISAATIAYCSKKVRAEADKGVVPLMGVLGAFIFAAQMINFTIPITGSSGHLGGGIILAVLLGPHAAFLTIASVLVVQALFFADGGLLALGCNIFNLGFFPAFIAYPLIYKKIVGTTPTPTKISVATMIAAVVGLQLGAFGVVVETVLSGISSLPFGTFAAIMQPIHLAIGIVEGLVTASVISFVYKARPEILQSAIEAHPIGVHPIRNVAIGFLAVSVITGGFFSWFASEHPDGLEWSITKVTGQEELKGEEQGLHGTMAALQKSLAFLPDYSFKKAEEAKPAENTAEPVAGLEHKKEEKKPEESKLGTSVSGIVGGTLTLGLSLLIGFILRRREASTPA
ncbi:MAG: energy-coupling factor ABC transporter permease [Desulfuromonadaceae bacterium]|nr:energy-coupling factor ABC transporter permease [Desulfuromonadaceae bacterium]MDD5107433.1 energy-coupling factor ABC transporter permease [Desulfuromonadaceae bacterium]